jgi:hypothetical protein
MEWGFIYNNVDIYNCASLLVATYNCPPLAAVADYCWGIG